MDESFRKILIKFNKRAKDSHKGQFGRVGLVTGSSNMMGAALLAAKAALRMGAGLVYVMVPIQDVSVYVTQCPELIFLSVPTENGIFEEAHVSDIQSFNEQYKFSSMAIGPGLGRDDQTMLFVKGVLSFFNGPMIVDADAIYAIDYSLLKSLNQALVLTPHKKEFELNFGPVLNREQSAQMSVSETRHVMVLKGSQTVIATTDKVVVNQTGNPGMATAGSGDVLTGIVACLLGTSVLPFEAAVMGVFLHGVSGDLAYEKMFNGLIASDIIESLPQAVEQECHV